MPESNQNPAGSSKAAKFVAANPLAPMANPFSGMGDEESEVHKEVSDGIQKRVEQAMTELQEKHRAGTNDVDDPDRAPTGHAYRDLQRRQAAMQQQARRAAEARDRQNQQHNEHLRVAKERLRRLHFNNHSTNESNNNSNNDSNNDSDDDDDAFLNDDPELERIRQARIQQLRQAQSQRALHKSLGHGDYRTISQDQFLPECTGASQFVCVHFSHPEFQRCHLMDHHLTNIAALHLECKFLKIDATKSPFFVHKLNIRTLPSLLVFQNGKEIGRLMGFQGLATNPDKPDQFPTGRLQEWISSTGAIQYDKPKTEDDDGDDLLNQYKHLGITVKGSVWSNNENHFDED